MVLSVPAKLTKQGRKAAVVINRVLKGRGLTPEDVGSSKLYTPEEWADRGENYGTASLLVIVHEEGDHRPFFSLDAAYVTGLESDYDRFEEMKDALGEHGLCFETCTTWYSAIYPM